MLIGHYLLAAFAVTVLCVASTVPERASADENGAPANVLPPEARQFDFWLGRWDVRVPGGGVASNNITAFGLESGIAILEDYGGGSYRGTSVSLYSPATGKWHQTWLDTGGLFLSLAGEFRDGKMVLGGEVIPLNGGAPLLGRLSYHNIRPNGEFDQLFEISSDGGRTWQVDFSGHYTRALSLKGALSDDGAATLSPSPIRRFGPNLGRESAGGVLAAKPPRESREFDFLLGRRQVAGSDVTRRATHEASTYGVGKGIAVLETLRSEGGYESTSVMIYDGPTSLWRRISVDTNGLYMELLGGMDGDRMVLSGTFTDPETGDARMARLTWSNITENEFDLTHEVSEDAGVSWALVSTTHYAKEDVSKPEALVAAKIKAKKVKLAWNDTSEREDRFEILQRIAGEWVVVTTLKANAKKGKVKGLTSGTTYEFGVRACNALGCSEPAEITVTTP